MHHAVEYVLYELLGKGNFSLYDEVVAKDVQVHYPSSWTEVLPAVLQGREKARRIDLEYSRAFHITQVEIHDCLQDHDKIHVRWSFTGIHHRDFFDRTASFRPLDITGQTVYEFNERKQICRVWQAWDLLGLLRQTRKNQQDLNGMSKSTSVLSPRELECLRYLVQGKTAKETAQYLHLSFRTVEYYFENIKNKLSCSTKRELLAYAYLLEKFPYSGSLPEI